MKVLIIALILAASAGCSTYGKILSGEPVRPGVSYNRAAEITMENYWAAGGPEAFGVSKPTSKR